MPAKIFLNFDPQNKQLLCQGKWNLVNAARLEKDFRKVPWPSSGTISFDGKAITTMDSAGAWILHKWLNKLTARGLKVQLQNFSVQQEKLLSLLTDHTKAKIKIPKVKFPNPLTKLGKTTYDQLLEIGIFLSFVGTLAVSALRVLGHPRHMRWSDTIGLLYKAGYQALPIIALLAFMVGVVLAYQTGLQLQKYGASIFIIDLLGYSVFREFGPLITAIMVAARSGSAFTAQLGIMKINQEIDALNTMGVPPAELLLLPRVFALVIALPLLTIWANIFAIIGGMLVTAHLLHISWVEFLTRFQHEVPLRQLILGLGKTPVFALIIASMGCFQGMQVASTADSLGKLTTRSVVLSIFLIVVADAIFSVVFGKVK